MMSQTPMTQWDVSRIQSTQARNGHSTGADSFASRAQSAGDRNAASSYGHEAQGQEKTSGGGGGGFGKVLLMPAVVAVAVFAAKVLKARGKEDRPADPPERQHGEDDE